MLGKRGGQERNDSGKTSQPKKNKRIGQRQRRWVAVKVLGEAARGHQKSEKKKRGLRGEKKKEKKDAN